MKRFSILIAICILVMLIPVPVSASGTCGENVTWELDAATGVMTIAGQGEMDAGEHSPWLDYRKSMKKIVIQEGITSISYGAFAYCAEVEEVVLPESLWCIEGKAFNSCTKLTTIDLTHVTSIGKYAFDACGFSEVKIPVGVTKVSYGTFSNCSKLSSVIFHDGVTELESYAFSGCVALTSVQLPDQMQIVGSCAFVDCVRLSDIQLNEGLRVIGNNAFSRCLRLKKVTIPDSVQEIHGNAFNNCEDLNEVILGAGVSQIDVTAFWGSKNLAAFTLSSENSSFSVDRGVLYSGDKTELKIMPTGFAGEYVIPDGTTSIAPYACTETGITALTIPGSVTTVGENSFAYCTYLQSIILQNGIQVIRLGAFQGTPISQITIPESVSKIDNQAFSGCKSLTRIIFKGAPPELGEIAFSQVTSDAFHPGHITEWKKAEKLYGGILTWQSFCSGVHVPVGNIIKDPTCTESGLAGETRCSICDEVIEGQREIPATGHKYGAWVEKTPPTTENEGVAERRCSACGAQEQKVLEKLPQEPSEPVEPDQPSEPTVPESTPATEPDQPSEPTVPESTPVTESDQPVTSDPTGTEPDLPSQSEHSKQEEPEGVKWVAVVAVAAVSLAIGLGASSLIFRRKKERR